MIKHIICAVRGGIESRETANRAIDLALKYAARLTFLYIVDRHQLSLGNQAASNKGSWDYLSPARTNILAFCKLAREQGLSDVEFILQRGDTRHKLCQMAVATDAELMVLGHPRPDSTGNVFSHDEFHQFLTELDLGGDLRAIQICLPSNTTDLAHPDVVTLEVAETFKRGSTTARKEFAA